MKIAERLVAIYNAAGAGALVVLAFDAPSEVDAMILFVGVLLGLFNAYSILEDSR